GVDTDDPAAGHPDSEEAFDPALVGPNADAAEEAGVGRAAVAVEVVRLAPIRVVFLDRVRGVVLRIENGHSDLLCASFSGRVSALAGPAREHAAPWTPSGGRPRDPPRDGRTLLP